MACISYEYNHNNNEHDLEKTELRYEGKKAFIFQPEREACQPGSFCCCSDVKPTGRSIRSSLHSWKLEVLLTILKIVLKSKRKTSLLMPYYPARGLEL